MREDTMRKVMHRITDALVDHIEREARAIAREQHVSLYEAADLVIKKMAQAARRRMAARRADLMESISNWDEQGYWLSPDGPTHHVYRDPWRCHAAWAMDHLSKAGEQVPAAHANAILVRRGWIRVSQEFFEVWRMGEREKRLIAGFLRTRPLYMALERVEVFEAKRKRRRMIRVCALLAACP